MFIHSLAIWLFICVTSIQCFQLTDLQLPLFESSSSSSDLDQIPQFAQRPNLFRLHRDLVQINSVSYYEHNVTKFLVGYLEKKGLTVELLPTPDGRNNVYAYSGKNRNATVLLTSHIDTVPPYFGYSIEKHGKETRIHGRGTADAKASVSSQITAFEELVSEGKVKQGDVAMLFVVGEEVGGNGMRAADKQLLDNHVGWKTVIFGEPTSNALAVGHKGIYYFHLRVYGHSCHSAYPELGVDANRVLIRIMNDLLVAPWPGSKLLGNTTINIGEIEMSNAANVLSPFAACTALIRVASSIKEVSALVQEVIHRYIDEAQGYAFEIAQEDDPSYLNYDVPGFKHSSISCSTDVPNMVNTGFKRYLYGPGMIRVSHALGEYITPESLMQGVDDYKTLVLHGLSN